MITLPGLSVPFLITSLLFLWTYPSLLHNN